MDDRLRLKSFIVGKDKSFIQANIKALKQKSTGTYIVPPMYERRLDLISHFIYGTVELKYLLVYVNEIIDVSVVKHGYVMKYPEIRDILQVMNETSDYI